MYEFEKNMIRRWIEYTASIYVNKISLSMTLLILTKFLLTSDSFTAHELAIYRLNLLEGVKG